MGGGGGGGGGRGRLTLGVGDINKVKWATTLRFGKILGTDGARDDYNPSL